MTGAIALPPPVAVEDLKSPADRMRCLPFNATIFARACVEKRRLFLSLAKNAGPKPGQPGAKWDGGPAMKGENKCSACTIGPLVEEFVGEEVDKAGAAAIATLPPEPGPRRRQRATFSLGTRPRPGSVPKPEPEPGSRLSAVLFEFRRLQSETARNVWRMGRLLLEINKTESWWKPKHETWAIFTSKELGLDAGYSYKLMDVAREFTEAEVLACGTAKLIKILPVPKERRPELVELAKTASLVTVRAEAKRLAHEATSVTRETARSPARPRPVAPRLRKLNAGGLTQAIPLYKGRSMDRARRVGDEPRGWLNIGGTVYVFTVHEVEGEGLVLRVRPSGDSAR